LASQSDTYLHISGKSYIYALREESVRLLYNHIVMKKLTISLLVVSSVLVFSVTPSFCQTGNKSKSDSAAKVTGMVLAQTQPEFPGGPDSLKMFLTRNMVYPEASRVARKQGHVFIGYKVDRTGAIKDPYILYSVTDDIDAEALRLVRLMPAWNPATVAGKPVDKNYVLEIAFVIPGSRK
jgi:TonB family protein